MSNEPPTYSALSTDEQTELSVWIESFEDRFPHEGATRLKQTLGDAPLRLRSALLSQLLPLLIDDHRKRHSVTPTLHELRLAHPDLAEDLAGIYSLLSPDYRLPVELRGYRVLRVVGEGGQAVVLKAQDDVHSAVAIKLSVSSQHNELLLRERRLLGECHHPGIPEVIASGINEERAFYIMPFLRGKTLADRYATFRPDPAEATRIAGELCSIVTHLHSHGILHRDIKPANVWLDDQGTVKLIDLGMALERTSWGKPMSNIREFHGTPAFMSPEQAAADGERDGELSDVFSIGATLYWLGTGSPPFDGSSGESVLSKAAACQYDQDRLKAVTDWPKGLTSTCLKALADDPSKRFRSAAEFGSMLAKADDKPRRSAWSRVAFLLSLLILAGLLVGGLSDFSSLLGKEQPVANGVDSPPPLMSQSPRHEEVPSARPHSETTPLPEKETETAPVDPRLKSPTGPAKPAIRTMLFIMPEPRIATHEVEQFIRNATPRLPTPPNLDFSLTAEQKSKNARAWIASLRTGTKMGHLAGIRFHPTSLVPIGPALKSVKVTYKSRQEPNGPPVPRTLTRKDFSNLDMPPIWVYEGITRPLVEDDRTEYATDTSESPVPLPRSFVMQVPPGLMSVSFYGELRDGSRTPTYEVQNDDFTLANQIFPLSKPPQGLMLDAYLFLYRAATIDRANGLIRYLDKPIDANAPFRGRLERTQFGFYVTPPEGVSSIDVVSNSNVNTPLSEVKPGSVSVTYRFPGMVVGPITFQLPRERFQELADDAMVYSEFRYRD